MNKESEYKKQRRNTYGENSKSSRKNIPLNKSLQNRKIRRIFKDVDKVNSEEDVNDYFAKVKIMKRFKKSPDTELGEVLIKKIIYRLIMKQIIFDECFEKLIKIRNKYSHFTIAFKNQIGYALNRLLPELIITELKLLMEKVMA
ncbi:MAG: hypothetical protein HQM10_24840 [Candidatus Riflebacteria bacterium]|nr:hypothetical protein [Candidatus Riflebacteria bacterium]